MYTDVEVASPLTLTIEAGRYFTVGHDPESADKRGDRPGPFMVKVHQTVVGCTARARCVSKDLGCVFG